MINEILPEDELFKIIQKMNFTISLAISPTFQIHEEVFSWLVVFIAIFTQYFLHFSKLISDLCEKKSDIATNIYYSLFDEVRGFILQKNNDICLLSQLLTITDTEILSGVRAIDMIYPDISKGIIEAKETVREIFEKCGSL